MQTHDHFKLFHAPLTDDATFGKLTDQIEAFVRDNKLAPKSIGAEYLESTGELLVSLGYRDDEPATPVQVRAIPIGVFRSAEDFPAIEAAVARAAGSVTNIICHELFVKSNGELRMIFMSLV